MARISNASMPTPLPDDRRSGKDRRVNDAGPPPGRPDKRRSIEPRKPDVIELELSESDWTAFSEQASGPPP